MCRQPRRVRRLSAILLAGVLSAPACGDAINILSQIHRAWGNIEEVSYDITDVTPVSGAGSKYVTSDGEGLVTMSSETLGSSVDAIIADAQISSAWPYLISNQARAQVVYEFNPLGDSLGLTFVGASGQHWFESGMYYLLEDLSAGYTIDERS